MKSLFLIHFLKNHALLQLFGGPTWRTVEGGSRIYVEKMQQVMQACGVDIRTGAPVQAVRRTPRGAEVKTNGQEWETFDEVVLATHSDDSLRLLTDASKAERECLGAITYHPNTATLHADPRCMPKRKAVWASWAYRGNSKHGGGGSLGLTYWINRLQSLPTDENLFVTLNAAEDIAHEKIYDQTVFHHPRFDRAAVAAQAKLARHNGANNTWFCGAWLKHGFHEDGYVSALEVAQRITKNAAYVSAAE